MFRLPRIGTIAVALAVVFQLNSVHCAEAAQYFMAPGGSDGNPGTSARPWKTLRHAVTRLRAGDTLYLAGGIYRETNVSISNLQGTATAPIKIVNQPGEKPILDGTLPDFREVGNSDWELVDSEKEIYRSTKVYTELGGIRGKFEHAGQYYALISYADYAHFSAEKETVDAQAYYVGPGVYLNSAEGRIYVRLKSLSAQTTFGRVMNIPSNSDPRQNRIYVYREEYGLSFSDTPSNYVTIDGIGLQFHGGAIRIFNDSQNITIRNIEAIGGNFLIVSGAANNLLVDNVFAQNNLPKWVSWVDMKDRTIGRPAKSVQNSAVTLMNESLRNVEIRNSTFTDFFDGVLAARPVVGFRLHHNNIAVWDDTVQLGTGASEVEIGYNRIYGPGPSHHGVAALPAQPGTVYVHHNIVDCRREIMWSKPDPDGVLSGHQGWTVLRPFPTHDRGNAGDGHPWKIYNNTVVWGDRYASTDPGFSEWVDSSQDVAHEVYNNIFDSYDDGATGDSWMIYGAHVDEGDEIYDGNAYYRHIRTTDPLFEEFRAGSSTQSFRTLASFKASKYFTISRSRYPPGWEASGIEADPKLNSSFIPQNNRVVNGGINISAKSFPGIDGTYRGAIKPGTDGSQIGAPASAIATDLIPAPTPTLGPAPKS